MCSSDLGVRDDLEVAVLKADKGGSGEGGITNGDRIPARAALSTQNQEAKDRNVVIRTQRCATGWASGIWENNGLFPRHAMNDNVEKAANDCP